MIFFFFAVVANFLRKGFCDDGEFLQYYNSFNVGTKYANLCITIANRRIPRIRIDCLLCHAIYARLDESQRRNNLISCKFNLKYALTSGE